MLHKFAVGTSAAGVMTHYNALYFILIYFMERGLQRRTGEYVHIYIACAKMNSNRQRARVVKF